MARPDSFFRPIGGSELPRFAGRSTFMRLPQIEDPAEVDIALVGFPSVIASTNRVCQRPVPPPILPLSTLIRLFPHCLFFTSPLPPYRCFSLFPSSS